MKSKELCVYLERLRAARNISQEAFTDEVVSLRQYRRYLSGESDIPFQVIHQLTAKLSVKTDTLLRDFDFAKVIETDSIIKMYNHVANYNFEEYVKLYNKIPLDHIIESNNRMLYQYSHILYQFLTKKASKEETAQANIRLVNYPKVLNQQIITSIEMLILSSFLDFLDESHHEKIVDKIEDFIKNQSIMISDANEKIYIFVLAKLAKYVGIREDYRNVIRYCNLGIEKNTETMSYYLMEYFYYYTALAYYNLEDYENYEKNLVHCFNVLQFDSNQKKIEKFTNLINADFDIEFKDFVVDYYQKNKENKQGQ
ncbi:MAG: helix-turn-helix transcriptional regulator [Acholeplasmataceae bacterium]|jgi:transcriptional regulator with XRE-family HTH domain|nr:helix-turn-helix transcriptional regulator [Acholeplasmataceae bacterium]